MGPFRDKCAGIRAREWRHDARIFQEGDRDFLFAASGTWIPSRGRELNYVNPYHVAGGRRAVGAGDRQGREQGDGKTFPIADTPQKMVKLGEAGLTQHIKTIGLVPQQGQECDRALAGADRQSQGSEVPRDREALEALPGVGRKTANVVLNVAFGEPTIAVDTHIFRVANRTGLAPGKNPLAVELALEKCVPAEFKLHAHHWLILHGRYTCIARKPHCPTCVVRDLCRFKDKTARSAAAEKPRERRKKREKKARQETGGEARARSASRQLASAACARALRQGFDMAHRERRHLRG